MEHLNRKIKSALLILIVLLIAFIGFSKAGILFSVGSGDVVTVSTTKKTFDPNFFSASVYKKEEKKNVLITSDVTTTTKTEEKETTSVIKEENIYLDLNYDGETLEQISKKLNNKFKGALSNQGEFLAKLSIEKGMDPYLVAAISVHETAYGQSSAAVNKYNFGGIMCSGKLCVYDSVEHGLVSFVNVIYKNYFSKGLTTAEAMNSKYAADTTWAIKVNGHYKTLKN